MNKPDFSQLVSEILTEGRNIRNIGLARNNIITHIFPLAGNESALGFEYRKNSSQWPAVKRAIDAKGTVVAGPVNLVQGGSAFIARTPIYTRNDISGPLSQHKPSYWGMASIVIDIPSLFQSAGISQQSEGLSLALRGKDGLGDQG
ncbi:MAG: CHASE domain-containing protein, partial [Candidatus Thiodiazotropha sp.]